MLTSDASTTFAVIDAATGAILRTGTAEIEYLADLIDHDSQDLIAPVPEGVSDDTHYWTGENFAVYPPRPGDWGVWTGAEWVDPRTPEDLAAEATARLHTARDRASMTRLQFALTAAMAGIIPPEDAPAAARGDIPPSMTAAFAALPPADRLVAETVWAGATVIDRLNPVLLMFAEAMEITDAQMDAMFRVAP